MPVKQLLGNKLLNYGLRVAIETAKLSKDPSTKVGAVIMSKSGTLLSTGYNGFPRGMSDSPERYLDKEYKYRHVIHAEANAILNCVREGVSTIDSVLIVTHPPCVTCACKIKQAGISWVIYNNSSEEFKKRWSVSETVDMFKELNLPLSYFDGHGIVDV